MTSLTRPRLAALAGLGLLSLAGCSAADAAGDAIGDAATGGGAADTSASYADGSYTADGAYVSPGGNQSVTVTLTLADDIVTEVTVESHAADPTSQSFQAAFISGIAAEVVGKDIDTLEVSRVSGSSLTSSGFNEALAAIKAEALAS